MNSDSLMDAARMARRWATGGLVLLASMLHGCAAVYVDGNQPEVPKSAFTKPAAPQPVQLVFEFQTRGAANARATELLRAKVTEQITDSGLFSSVGTTAAPGTALLTFTLNNVPLGDDAASKGFIAGLTFGLVGQTVGDGYDASLRFMPAAAPSGTPAPVVQQAKHVIYTSLGNAGPPPGATKTATIEEAVFTMLRQVLSKLLSGLSQDPGFRNAPPASAVPAAARAAP